jgi:hypothetical protein
MRREGWGGARRSKSLENPPREIPTHAGISRMIAITTPRPASPGDGHPSTSPDNAQEGARTKRRARAGDAGGREGAGRWVGGVNKGYPTELGARGLSDGGHVNRFWRDKSPATTSSASLRRSRGYTRTRARPVRARCTSPDADTPTSATVTRNE